MTTKCFTNDINCTTEPLGNLNGLYPIILFHIIKRATYCNPSPSFFKSGHILNTATLFINTPHPNVVESIADPERRRVMGKRGRRMDFSWTWKENMKKAIEEVNIV